jgi:hypothetical protein
MGVHPTHSVWEGKIYDHPRQHSIALMCDDIDATDAQFRGSTARSEIRKQFCFTRYFIFESIRVCSLRPGSQSAKIHKIFGCTMWNILYAVDPQLSGPAGGRAFFRVHSNSVLCYRFIL